MKVSHFRTGGFVVHGMTGYWRGRVSGWYNANGELVDAEQITAKGVRPVPHNGPMWQALAHKGRVHTDRVRQNLPV